MASSRPGKPADTIHGYVQTRGPRATGCTQDINGSSALRRNAFTIPALRLTQAALLAAGGWLLPGGALAAGGAAPAEAGPNLALRDPGFDKLEAFVQHDVELQLAITRDTAAEGTPESYILRLTMLYRTLTAQNVGEVTLWWTTPQGSRTPVTMRLMREGFWATRVTPEALAGTHKLSVVAVFHDPETFDLSSVIEQHYLLEMPAMMLARDSQRTIDATSAAAAAAKPAAAVPEKLAGAASLSGVLALTGGANLLLLVCAGIGLGVLANLPTALRRRLNEEDNETVDPIAEETMELIRSSGVGNPDAFVATEPPAAEQAPVPPPDLSGDPLGELMGAAPTPAPQASGEATELVFSNDEGAPAEDFAPAENLAADANESLGAEPGLDPLTAAAFEPPAASQQNSSPAWDDSAAEQRAAEQALRAMEQTVAHAEQPTPAPSGLQDPENARLHDNSPDEVIDQVFAHVGAGQADPIWPETKPQDQGLTPEDLSDIFAGSGAGAESNAGDESEPSAAPDATEAGTIDRLDESDIEAIFRAQHAELEAESEPGMDIEREAEEEPRIGNPAAVGSEASLMETEFGAGRTNAGFTSNDDDRSSGFVHREGQA